MMEGLTLRFQLPWIRRQRAAAKGDEATKAVVDAARDLKRQADEVIRAAYALADDRLREQRQIPQPAGRGSRDEE
jgi:hypothetical protein